MASPAMELDPRTLVVGSVLSALLLGSVSLAFATLSGSQRIIASWGMAMLVLALGLLGLGLRDEIPFWLSAVVGNWLIVAAIVLAMRALRVFVGSAPRDVLSAMLLGALLLVLLYFTEARPSNVGRTVAISAALGIVAVRAAVLLRRRAPAECRRSSRVTEYVFWAVAAITALRIVGTLFFPPSASLAPGAFNAAVFLFYSGFIIVSSLSVMWMEIERLQADLVYSARFDSLTGVLNRGTFLGEFEREVSRAARGGAPFSLAIFDLDRFKLLNDRFGHPTGDLVLKAFADVLRQGIRKHDTVGRYGGEEFALLMPETGKDTALRVAERVRRELATRGVSAGGTHIQVTTSGGVATYGIDGLDWDSLLSTADTALYAAKESGRNRIVGATAPATG
jgi:diguanylate cyclase (GGDEF)-like protein